MMGILPPLWQQEKHIQLFLKQRLVEGLGARSGQEFLGDIHWDGLRCSRDGGLRLKPW
jgi:hypothetical protein